ncbi:uncharacterized protein LOC116105070 [Pistacia vera]|uniref:uncharacterized protein LOC116105070 n=1 Tax=Pistacia vera TaxID=55513 RepID=UPI0012634EAD|nr:uncharacterized protein LOC116105070 [Pistacia vera]
MSQLTSLFLFFLASLAFFSFARAQDRAPHGLLYANPMTFPPSAVEFFHPKTQKPETFNPCASSNCSPLPLAAQVEATKAHESESSRFPNSGSRVAGSWGAASIVFGSVFFVLLQMGV